MFTIHNMHFKTTATQHIREFVEETITSCFIFNPFSYFAVNIQIFFLPLSFLSKKFLTFFIDDIMDVYLSIV